MSNLYSVVLNLIAQNEATIPPTQGYHAYALFLDLFRRTSPEIAEELHTSAPFKPFTISPLQGSFYRSGHHVKLTAGLCYWIRVTFLKEDILAYFMDSALKTTKRSVHLDSAVFQMDRVLFDSRDSPLCRHQTYEELFSESVTQAKITLQFFSPTTFRSRGKRNIIFPEPSLVFGSYLAKWQYFAPLKITATTSMLWREVFVSQYRLNTHIWNFSDYQEVGLEGRCTFQAPEETAEETLKTLNALADFAFYCGTGAKTTMGMGQTRRLK